jgi:hypothetical protein
MRRPAAIALTPLLVFALLLGLPAPRGPADFAQAGPPPDAPDNEATNSASVVKAGLRPAAVSAAAGGVVAFDVVLTIADGWHLYAHGDTTFYGIDLKGLDKGPLAGAAIGYPAGKRADFFGTPVDLLTGRQSVHVRATLTAGASGKLEVPLGLEVQACDDQRCLAPATIPLKLKLEARGPGSSR